MKDFLWGFSGKFDSMDEMRRKLAFLAILVLFAFSMHLFFMEPLLSEQKSLSNRIARNDAQLKGVNAAIENQLNANLTDPDLDNRRRISELKKQLADADASLSTMQQKLMTPKKMSDLLEKVLKENPRIRLVQFHSISDSSGKSVLYRQGVNLTLRGSFPDLMEYLSELKNLPWQIYWDKMEFRVDDYPDATMNLTLHTLSLEKSWLDI